MNEALPNKPVKASLTKEEREIMRAYIALRTERTCRSLARKSLAKPTMRLNKHLSRILAKSYR